MSLPKCVKIDVRDRKSAAALAEDGWREVGICDEYRGGVEGVIRNAKQTSDCSLIWKNLERYDFSGRLWRDPDIPKDVAIKETKNFIYQNTNSLFELESGFGIFHRRGEVLRIGLIGCLEQGKGICQDIIRSAVHHFETKKLIAGTYTDNIPARELYDALDMTLWGSERVFHK